MNTARRRSSIRRAPLWLGAESGAWHTATAHYSQLSERAKNKASLAFSDGTFAIDLDPLSLLCRLATSVPPETPS